VIGASPWSRTTGDPKSGQYERFSDSVDRGRNAAMGRPRMRRGHPTTWQRARAGTVSATCSQGARAARQGEVDMTAIRTFTGILGAFGAAALALPPGAHGAGPSGGDGDLGGYRFRYRVNGVGEAAPLQVFDDGRQTYFQFPSGDRLPRIVAFDDEGARVVPPAEVRPPYVVVASVAPRFELTSSDRADTRDAAAAVVVQAAGDEHVALAAPTSAVARRVGPPPASTRPTEAAGADLLDQARDLYRRAVAQRDAEAERLVLAAIRLLDRDARERPATAEAATPQGAGGAGERRPRNLSHVAIPIADYPPTAALSVAPRAPSAGSAPVPMRPVAARAVPAASTPSSEPRYPSVAAVATVAAIGNPGLGLAGQAPWAPRDADRARVASGDVPSSDTPSQTGPGAPAHARQSDAGGGVRAASDVGSAEAPRPSTAAATLVFQGAPGQRVSEALRSFLLHHGWAMEWESDSDYTIRRGYEVTGATIEDVLVGVLGDYQLSAVVYRGNRVVAIATAEPGRR
jgi:Conjugal transfer protein